MTDEGRLLADECRCGEYADAACPDHGLLAFISRGIAAQEAVDETTAAASRGTTEEDRESAP